MTECDVNGLMEIAREAAFNSYVPYMGIQRAAVLIADDGSAFVGVKVELATYSGSLCAEMAALANAIAVGKRKFSKLILTPSGFPCGSCRQALAEFGIDLQIICDGDQGAIESRTLAELLPASFGSSHLG